MPGEFDYQRYLASREWAMLRERVRLRAAGRCERCELLPMAAVHHLTYERVGHERMEDLQGICRPCHRYVSAKSDFDLVAWSREVEAVAEPYWLDNRVRVDFSRLVGLLALELGDVAEDVVSGCQQILWQDKGKVDRFDPRLTLGIALNVRRFMERFDR